MSGKRSRNEDYKVGYSRPPKASQFKPGQSGNPRGRPKGSRSAGAILRDAMSRKISITENGKTRRVSVLEGMVHRLRSDALRGDKPALRMLLQMVERYGENDQNVTHSEDFLPEDAQILAQYEREIRDAAKRSTADGDGVEDGSDSDDDDGSAL